MISLFRKSGEKNYYSNLNRSSLIKRKIVGFLFSLFRYLLLIGISYIVLFPLLYMLALAFRPSEELTDPTVIWLTKNYTIENIKTAFEMMDYVSSFIMTLMTCIISAIIQLVSSSLCAYGLARFKFKERNFIFALVIFTIIVPMQAILIPLYSQFVNFDILGILGMVGKVSPAVKPINLLNSPASFYLPAIFSVGINSGFSIFIYHQFFTGFPVELEEAAWIDGAGPLKTFIRIVLPSSGVALLVVFIFSVVWYWNDYMLTSLLFEESQPLAVQLMHLRSKLIGINSSANKELLRNYLMAGSLIYISPLLIFYLCVQNRFIQSIERVGIVG